MPSLASVFAPALARCYLALARYDDALATSKDLIQTHPNDVSNYIIASSALYAKGRREEAISTLDTAAGAIAPHEWLARTYLARQYFDVLQTGKAEREATIAAREAQADPQPALLLGRILIDEKKKSEARRVLEGVLARSPDNPAAHSLLGQLWSKPGHSSDEGALAEHHLLVALQHARGNPASCKALAQLLMEEHRYKQAAFFWLLLLQAEPDSAEGRMQLARAYGEIGESRLSEDQSRIAQTLVERDTRETEFQSRLTEAAMDPDVRVAFARHYLHYGQFAKALPQVEAAVGVAPSAQASRRLLADFYAGLGLRVPDFNQVSHP